MKKHDIIKILQKYEYDPAYGGFDSNDRQINDDDYENIADDILQQINLNIPVVTKRIFHFDYIARTYLSEFNRVGEGVTENIHAYDEEHAICLFKEKHGDTPYDPPY